MKLARFVGLLASLWMLHAVALAATPSWSHVLSGPPDGASYGDVDGDGRLEVAVIVRGVPGELVLLSDAGEVLWTHTATGALVGFPTFGDYDGNGTDEIAYCESGTDSPCRVLNADGTVRYSFGNYYYPGMSGSGPTAADVDGDGADDLLVTSWGGEAVLVDGASGTMVWSYDAWEERGELLFGPSVVTDVDGDGDLEAVFGGWQEGSLFMLDAATGAEVWTPIGLWSTWGNYFHGNGALVDDLDGDGSDELVVSVDGETPSVAAFSAAGENLWRVTLPASSWFAWLTPVATDLDADGSKEILAQSGDGYLYVFDADGQEIAALPLGNESWIAPAFIDLDFDLRPEIVAATLDSLLFLDGESFAELDRYDDPSGGIYPQILVGDLGGDGQVNVVAGSWNGETIHHFSFEAANVSLWSALGGGPTHRGQVDLVCEGVCASPASSVSGGANLGDGVVVGPDASIQPGATVGNDAIVGPSSTLGWYSTVGDDVVIEEGVAILAGASVGDGSTVGAQSWIGWASNVQSDVVIGEGVVIGILTTIGTGSVIGDGTTIGSFTTIGANVTIGASCQIGRRVTVGDGVMIPNGTVIPNNTVLP